SLMGGLVRRMPPASRPGSNPSPSRRHLAGTNLLHARKSKGSEINASGLFRDGHGDIFEAFDNVARKRFDNFGPAGLPTHDADAAVVQRAEAVRLPEYAHAWPEGTFRQHRYGQARKDSSRNDGGREGCEQHAVVPAHFAQNIACRAPPDTVRPTESHGQHFLLMGGVVGRTDP